MPSNFTQLKRKMRRTVHAHLHRSVFFFSNSDAAYTNPILIKARLAYKYEYVGDQLGTNFSYAEKIEKTDASAIIYREDLPTPKKYDVLSFDNGEVYRVSTVEPSDDETYTVFLIRHLLPLTVPTPA